MKQRVEKTNQDIETDLYLFEFGIVAGMLRFCSVGFAEELIPMNSLILIVSTKVFNLSLPLPFLSLSPWLCYYKIMSSVCSSCSFTIVYFL